MHPAAQIGDLAFTVEETFGIPELVRWAGASGDFARIHFDPEYATTVAKLPAPIIHGPLKMAVFSRELIAWAGGDPASIAALEVKFVAMDVVGSTLEFSAEVDAVDTESIELTLRVASSGKISVVGRARVHRNSTHGD